MVKAHKPPVSETYPVSRIFKEHDPLVVPRWQRDYSWKSDDHVAKLIEDLNFFFESYTKDQTRYYLLGQVILVSNDSGEFEIVDGQQRLTTVYLLLAALRNAIKNTIDIQDLDQATAFANLNDSIVNVDKKVRFRTPFQSGTLVLQHLVESGNSDINVLGDLNKAQRNLIEVYEVIEEWINANLGTYEEIRSYVEAIQNRVYFARLTIDDIPLALDYFEKMNRRGLPLAAADLLKNYLFSQAPEEDFETLTAKWQEMSKEIDKVNRRALKNTESFIKYWAISESGSKLNGTEPLLNYWKENLSTKQKIDEFETALVSMGTVYRKIANGEALGGEPAPILEATRYFNGSQHIPVLFAGRHLDEFLYLCDLVERRFLVYLFGRERTANFESMIPNWCKKLRSLPRNATQEMILEATKSADLFILPNARDSIISTICGLDYSKTSHHRKMRAVLAITSRYYDVQAKYGDYAQPLSTYLTTVSKGKPGIDMDHVYGQTYFDDQPIETKKLFNSIGALALVFSSDHRENTLLKPDEKKSMYIKSRYVLTKSLAHIDQHEPPRVESVITEIQAALPPSLNSWNYGFVEKRSEFLANKFIEACGLEAFFTT